MADLALAQLVKHGHQPDRVLVNAHHLWRQVALWAEQNGVSLQVEQPDILGTGGGLAAAADRLGDRFVVFNGDILCDVDVTSLVNICPPTGAAMAVRQVAELGGMTPIGVDRSGKVNRIGDVVMMPGAEPLNEHGGGCHFTGIHAMSRRGLELIPKGGFACVIRTAYSSLIPVGAVVGLQHTGSWVDVGTPGRYLQANMDALAGRLKLSIDPWTRGERYATDSWLGSKARVEGTVSQSVIGAGAVIPATSSLKQCVVWDGCVAPPNSQLQRAIVYGDGLVLSVG